jgi:FAD/FMN-containing dehydrogenase
MRRWARCALGEEGETSLRNAYPGATWERLSEVKARYDPGNLFQLNHNIPPKNGITGVA